MKYQKVTFTITDDNGNSIKDLSLAQIAKDILCSLTADAGLESFEEQDDRIVGYAQKEQFDKATLDGCLSDFPVGNMKITYNVEDAEDKNWNETWEEEGFEPIFVANKCVIHDTVHPISDVGKDLVNITIDAKQAFGTGTHETTRMIVNELTGMDLKGKTVLDCGCGTGILSVAAAKFGARSITGYDIDEWSVRNTGHNCSINGVDNVEVLLGDARVLENMDKGFDVILANINRNILLTDMPVFRQRMNDNAVLILSGFYVSDAKIILQEAANLGLKEVKTDSRNGWCIVVLTTDKQ